MTFIHYNIKNYMYYKINQILKSDLGKFLLQNTKNIDNTDFDDTFKFFFKHFKFKIEDNT